MVLAGGCTLCAQVQRPDQVLEGDVTEAQSLTQLLVPFAVPAGVHRLSVDFSYTHREDKTTLDMGVFDPNGFRGQSGSNKSHFTIGPADATASYLAGPIPAGTWKFVMSVSSIQPGVTSHYRVEIRYNSPLEDSSFTLAPLETGRRWYRGDLHMHTAHSDGSCLNQSGKRVPCPLFLTAQMAASRGLDFIAISDHNSMAHYGEMREIQPYFSRMLLIPGREITTFYGHFNAFGITQYVGTLIAEKGGSSIDQTLAEIKAQGGLASINHPMLPTDASCRGCGWGPPGPVDMTGFTSVEVVNGNQVMLPFWDEQIAKGHRLTGVGGSDNHDALKGEGVVAAIGHPATVVQADELSVAGLLGGIRKGHVFVDVTGSRNRVLEVEARAQGNTAHMGDVLAVGAGVEVAVDLHVVGCAGCVLQAVVDGHASGKPMAVGNEDATLPWRWVSDGKRHWIRFVVQDEAGKIDLVGNPVYVNF